ncbi:MAG: SDR family NAD(P)-dependent oxidoreductase [Amaricoccus sp.]|uniref:SDR family NAD(P)-dependent oxidoreductase n=1 Tax=Amaricoccus sp. TaxID=1872485 RepID=UPI0039E540A5
MAAGIDHPNYLAEPDLSGHRILITGAGRGIGRGMAEAFITWGARVAVADISGPLAADTAAACGPLCSAVQIDVTDESAVERGIEVAWQAMDGIDLLVNNAGVLSVATVAEMTLAQWNQVMSVNATGVFLMSRAVVRQMRHHARPGSILSLSSIAGRRGDPRLAHYSASKFAVVGFTQALAQEVAGDDILVNAICPGLVQSAMIGALAAGTGTTTDDWLAAQAIRRSQSPRDIAFAAAFLHLSRAVTGQAINVDGGTLFN